MARSAARSRLPAALALAALALAACGETTGEAPPAGATEIYGHEEPRFRMRVEIERGSRSLRAELRPRGVWHISPDYPVRLELAGEGLRLDRPRQGRDDAVDLSEERLAFQVGFEPEADASGRALAGTLRFGICRSAELCEPVTHPFEAEIP